MLKPKVPGISLLVAMIGSSIALGVVTAIMISLTQSVEQAQNIERSTQVFFAVESGLEAGFFHHNSRGQGTTFNNIDSVAPEQIIAHDNINLDTKWTIRGRADTSYIEEEIKEFTPLQLRWYWDQSTSVKEKINIVNHFPSFTLELKNPTSFDFDIPGGDTEPIASWLITKKDDTGVYALSPNAGQDPTDPCNAFNSTFICNNNMYPLSSSDIFKGSLAPRTPTSDVMPITDFTSNQGNNSRNYQVIINPLRSFTKADGSDTISGIQYALNEGNGINLPLPHYSIDTQVEALGFIKKLTLDRIPEASAISSFNYVIFN